MKRSANEILKTLNNPSRGTMLAVLHEFNHQRDDASTELVRARARIRGLHKRLVEARTALGNIRDVLAHDETAKAPLSKAA